MPNRGDDAAPVFWFRIPDQEDVLMDLRPAELRCYLVTIRAIQRDRNRGRLSDRQISDRARVGLRHATAAMKALLSKGLLSCERRPGSTSIYSLPVTWLKRGDCIPTGVQLVGVNSSPVGAQLEDDPNSEGAQLGVQHSSPVGAQNCIPTGAQHLELSESSELENNPDDSATLRQNHSESAEFLGCRPPKQADENLVALRYEMAAILGKEPPNWIVNDVLNALQGAELSAFVVHLHNVHSRYRPSGHRPVKFWKWFSSSAASFADMYGPKAAIASDGCRHGLPDGKCPECDPKAEILRNMEAF